MVSTTLFKSSYVVSSDISLIIRTKPTPRSISSRLGLPHNAAYSSTPVAGMCRINCDRWIINMTGSGQGIDLHSSARNRLDDGSENVGYWRKTRFDWDHGWISVHPWYETTSLYSLTMSIRCYVAARPTHHCDRLGKAPSKVSDRCYQFQDMLLTQWEDLQSAHQSPGTLL